MGTKPLKGIVKFSHPSFESDALSFYHGHPKESRETFNRLVKTFREKGLEIYYENIMHLTGDPFRTAPSSFYVIGDIEILKTLNDDKLKPFPYGSYGMILALECAGEENSVMPLSYIADRQNK